MNKLLSLLLFIIPALKSSSQIPTLQWATSLGYISSDYGTSIKTDITGNIYTCGYFYGTVDFDPGTGVYNLTSAAGLDIFIAKYNPNGNLIWAKNMGGTMHAYGLSLTLDLNANVYATGYFEGTVDFDPSLDTFNLSSAGKWDIFILKLDSAGVFAWAKSIGSYDFDKGTSITSDNSGNIYVTGFFEDTVDFDPGPSVFNLIATGSWSTFICKIDSGGNLVWAKSLDGNVENDANAITTDPFNNVYIGVNFKATVDFDPGPNVFNLTNAGFGDIAILKLDSGGNFLWVKRMGGSAIDICQSVVTDGVGNIFSTGYFNGTADFDPGAGIFNLISAGDEEIFISKLDSGGNFIWAKRIGGIDYDYSLGISLDTSINVYITGVFSGSVDFDPGSGTNMLNSNGSTDVFISKLDSSGSHLMAFNIGGVSNDAGNSLAIDAQENIYSIGTFWGSADFDPSGNILNLQSVGSADVFIAKYSQTVVGINEITTHNSFLIFPNPSSGNFEITFTEIINKGEIEIYNLLGKNIFSDKIINESKKEINVKNILQGIYFVKVVDREKSYCKKLIIQHD